MKPENKKQDHYAQWAKIWDEDPGRIKTAQTIAQAIRAQVRLTPKMIGLDFGCGTGLLTMFLQPYLNHITAVDISQEMLNQFKQKLKRQNINNIRVYDVHWEEQAFPGNPFDIIFSSMTLHHVDDLNNLFKKFYAELKINGWVCAADLYKEPGDFHSTHDGVAHFGFEPQVLQKTLERNGFANIRYEKIYTITKVIASGEKRSYPVFLICARKAREV